jgi:citrate lyase beta subunit
MNFDLEEALGQLPEEVAQALENWRTATLMREKMEALLYARYKGQDTKRTATDVKALVNADSDRYNAVLAEIKAESAYIRVYERLLAKKKMASLRSAY